MAVYNNIFTLNKVYQLSLEGSWWQPPAAPTSIEYLIVGAGGGGGTGYGDFYGGGGGGGAGANTGTFSQSSLKTAVFTITVGAGGPLSTYGGNSSILYGATTVNTGIAGYGGGDGQVDGPGGVSGTGYAGGASYRGNGWGPSGGGAAGAGYAYNDATYPRKGGAGVLISAFVMYGTDASNSNASVSGKGYFGGGGGSGNWYIRGNGPGGIGGGGLGGGTDIATAGLINTGGGGGGGSPSAVGGIGGSGLAVIRYPDSYGEAISVTGSPNVTISGGYRYYTFTSSGTLTFS